MGALLLIIPALAFDVWLGATVGKRQIQLWIMKRAWSRLAVVCGAGLVFAVCCLMVIRYQWDAKTRVIGFPVPLSFFKLEDKNWVHSSPDSLWLYLGAATNLVTGIAIPFIPFKVADFLKTVKLELQ